MELPKVVSRKIDANFYLIEVIDKNERHLPLFGIQRTYNKWYGSMIYRSDTHIKDFKTLKEARDFGIEYAKSIYVKYQ